MDLHEWWTQLEEEVVGKMCDRLQVDPQTLTVKQLDDAFAREMHNVKAIGYDLPRLKKVDVAMHLIHTILRQRVQEEKPPFHPYLVAPPDYNGDTFLTALDDITRMTDTQNAILGCLHKLHATGFRKADGEVYEPVFLKDGTCTMAFRRKESIEYLIHEMARPELDFRLWRYMTSSPMSLSYVSQYFSEHYEGPALPTLLPSHHLRSYGTDASNAGIYDCRADAFFPYAKEAEWPRIAARMTELRRVRDPNYVCRPPDRSKDVCMVHISTTFPHDILEEEESGHPRSWKECSTPLFDRLFRSLVEEDALLFYAFLGRLFFRPGELDECDVTLCIVPSCYEAKDNVLNTLRRFWPPCALEHLKERRSEGLRRGANKSLVIMEQNFKDHFPVNAREFASMSSNGILTVPSSRSFGGELITRWNSPMLCVMNALPWKNDADEALDHMAGFVLDENDSRRYKGASCNSAELQRKCILAYFDFLQTRLPDRRRIPAFMAARYVLASKRP